MDFQTTDSILSTLDRHSPLSACWWAWAAATQYPAWGRPPPRTDGGRAAWRCPQLPSSSPSGRMSPAHPAELQRDQHEINVHCIQYRTSIHQVFIKYSSDNKQHNTVLGFKILKWKICLTKAVTLKLGMEMSELVSCSWRPHHRNVPFAANQHCSLSHQHTCNRHVVIVQVHLVLSCAIDIAK